ncbi:MAG: hypothetical protein U0Q15_15100 [Kineosporiaceae bacterium]
MSRSRTLPAALAVAATVLATAAAVPAASAAPADPRAGLSSAASTTVEGTLRRVVVDAEGEFSGAHRAAEPMRTVAVVEVGGTLLRVPDSLAAGVAANRRVTLTLRTPRGLQRSAALAWAAGRPTSAGAVASLAPVRSASGPAASLVAGTTVAGAHTITVLPVYWGSKDSATVASLTTLAQNTADYWRQQSAGKVTTTVAVRDWKLITNPGSCDYTALYNAAIAAHGVSAPGGTDHVLVYFPQRSDCAWAGLAYVGGNVIWVNGYQLLDVTAHEFGHNLGLGHANTYACTSSGTRVPLSTSCTIKEYYDSADVMGFATYADTGSLNVGFADFLGLATVTSISATAGSATTVNLAPLNGYTGTRGVKIPVTGGTVYVEFRPASGRDVRQSNWAGVQVRMITSGGAPSSRLLDLQPWDASAFATSGSAVAMQPYYVWPVPDTSVAVKVTQVGSTATVAVVPTKGDTTKPSAAVLTSPGANSKVPSLSTVTWTAATDPGGAGLGAYAVVVDGSVVARVAGEATSASVPGVAAGTHTVRVDAYDNAGNVTTGTAASVTVDSSVQNSPPRITSPATMTLVTASPSVSWVLDTAAPTSVVLVDDVEATRTSGTSATLSGLADGVHTIAVRTLANDGLTLATSTPVTVKVDGTAPTAPTGVKFTASTATLSWSAAKDAVGVAGYDVRLDGTLLGRSATTTYKAALPSGSHTWSVTAVDKVGNTSAAATVATVTDATAAGAPVITSPAGGAVLTTTTPTVTFTGSTDADTGITGYRVLIDGAPAKTLLAADATSVTPTLRDGVHKLVVAAVNGAGLVTASEPVQVTVDVTAPSTPTKVGLEGTTLSWKSSTDRVTGVASYALFLDGDAAGTASASATSATVTTPLGRHVWSVKAIDAAGNTSVAGSAPAVWRDPSAPSTPAILSPADGAVTAKKQVTLKWSPAADAESGILGYRVRINGVAGRLTAASAVSASVLLGTGDNTVSVAAVNLAGVESAVSSVDLLVDTSGASAPSVTSPASSASVSGTTFTVSWAAASDDESGVTGYDVLVNGRVAATAGPSETSATVTVSARTATSVSIVVRARNGAGTLTSSASVKATVAAGIRVIGRAVVPV